MPLSIRQRLVDAFKLRLEGILTAGGYKSDLGRRVFIWRATPLGENEEDAINLRDVRQTTKTPVLGQSAHHHELTVWAEVLARAGTTSAERVREYLADIVKAIGVDRYWTEATTSVRLAFDTRILEDQMSVQQDGIIIAGARLIFAVEYQTKAFDPNSQR